MSNFWLLLTEFFKTGLFAVGGGLATIPFLREMSAEYGWFTVETLSTMIAVSESTPGPIGVNMATYVGYMTAGPAGGIGATLSLVAPSVIIICIIANYLQKFKEAKAVKMIFAGLKPAVVGFVMAACLEIFISALLYKSVFDRAWQQEDMGVLGYAAEAVNWKAILLLAVLFGVQKGIKKLHPIFLILLSAGGGILLGL